MKLKYSEPKIYTGSVDISQWSKLSTKQQKDDLILNDYSLMWNALKQIKENNPDGDKSYNILIGNMMRRILESYVNFTGIGTSVWTSIKNVNPEDTRNIICSSLVSEINDSSHKISPLDDIYFTRIMNEEPSALFNVFELIFVEIGQDHYELMMDVEIIIEESDVVAS